MKRIGIIGGMSPESTAHIYLAINHAINEIAGGQSSAEMLVRSVNFQKYLELMERGDWDTIRTNLMFEAKALYDGGCDYVAIATNTMHKVADDISAMFMHGIKRDPLVHIGDCIARECQKIDAKNVLLLGTKSTMTERFMSDRFKRYGIQAMDISKYPESSVDRINGIIFNELCHGKVEPDSKEFLIRFIRHVQEMTAPLHNIKLDAVILGCTELDMILTPEDIDNVPLIDSTQAQINELVRLSLSK